MQTSSRPMILLPLLLLAAGCETPPTYYPAGLPVFLNEKQLADVPPAEPGQTAETLPAVKRSETVTLPEAIEACVLTNLRIQSGREKVQQARADFLTDSLIPNPQLFVDGQLLPLQTVDINNQAGPPQYDANLTFPIDWWLFGKRVAAMEASRIGVDVANADYADLIRRKVLETVSAFYDLLESQEVLKLSEESFKDIQRIEDITKKQVEAGGAGTIELDRVKLAVLDAQRDLRLRRDAVAQSKAKLRPLIGRSAADPDFTIEGAISVKAVAPAPSLAEALALAEKHRPDLVSDRYSISQADAAIERERRKAKPTVGVTPGYSFIDQRHVTGFRDASLWSISMTTSLPFTDRNQGGIAKAESALRQNRLILDADLADARADVESALATYQRTVDNIQRDNPQTLEAAKNLREKTEAAYKIGGRKLLEVLDVQRAYRDRLQTSINNQADYWRALNRLNAAVGLRAFEADEKQKKKMP